MRLTAQICPRCIRYYFFFLHLSLLSIINQCNRTNGTILLGHFYDCIFSCSFLFSRIIYSIGAEHRLRLLEEHVKHKMLRDYVCIPSISNTRASHYMWNAFSCQCCVFLHLFLLCWIFESSQWDGRWRHHSRPLINT